MSTCPPGPASPPAVYFDAVLHPHRSLPPRGFVAVMAAVGACSFVAGVAFLLMGAWPVVGFFGLDAALVYLAFRLNYRAGRLVEHVRLTDTELRIERVHPSGRVEAWCLEPGWARAEIAATPGGDAVRLRARERAVLLGRFLLPEEQADFVRAFTGALARRLEGMAAAPPPASPASTSPGGRAGAAGQE